MKVINFSNVAGRHRGGGVHEVVYAFLLGQNELGLESHLWFPGYSHEQLDLLKALPKNAAEKVRALPTRLHPNYGLVRNARSVRSELLQFDIVHQHGVWLPISRISAFARHNGKCKLIVQPHGYLEPFSLAMSKFKKKVSYELFEKRNLDLADLLIACSNEEYKHLRKVFPNKDIAIVPNGINRSFIEAKASKDYFNNPRFKGKKNMLFLSRIHPLKGLERLFQVFAQVEHRHKNLWNLIIAGIGEESYISKLKCEVKKLGIDESVFFEGPVFEREKLSILSSADFFVLPTFSENYGIVIAEALSRGLPALTTKGAPWGLLEEEICGFHVENTIQGIRIGLEKIFNLSNKELKAMGEMGLNISQKYFLWENIVPKTLELYNWLMDKTLVKPDFVYLGDKGANNPKIL